MIAPNSIITGDCLSVMRDIPDGSVDMILCDLPYGTTACSWDMVIPFSPLWAQYKRIIKDSGAIVLTASQPFTTDLINSNRQWFRYEIIWEKTIFSNPLMAKKMPLKIHENVLVFYNKMPTYNPQKHKGEPYCDTIRPGGLRLQGQGGRLKLSIENNGDRFPTSVIKFSNGNNYNVHPTQKPVALFEYLIFTYTNPGDIVLDNALGSGTTAVAALKTGRRFIGIEISPEYCAIAQRRVDAVLSQTRLDL